MDRFTTSKPIRDPRWILSSVLALVFGLTVWACLAKRHAEPPAAFAGQGELGHPEALSVPGNPDINTEARKAGVDDSWLTRAMQVIDADAARPRIRDGKASLYLSGQNLRASLDAGAGLRVGLARPQLDQPSGAQSRPGSPNPLPAPTPGAGTWTFEWKTERFGRPGGLQEVVQGSPQVDGQRMVLLAPGLMEWYEHKRGGIEQGFTLAQRPNGSGEVRVESAAVAGCAMARSGQDLVVRDAAGRDVLRYGSLRVTDAGGRELKGRIELADCRISLVFDDRGASYPVTVDPLIGPPTSLTQFAAGNSGFGFKVAGVGDLNGDGFADVAIDVAETGRLYVFYGSAAGLNLTPTILTPAGGELSGLLRRRWGRHALGLCGLGDRR